MVNSEYFRELRSDQTDPVSFLLSHSSYGYLKDEKPVQLLSNFKHMKPHKGGSRVLSGGQSQQQNPLAHRAS